MVPRHASWMLAVLAAVGGCTSEYQDFSVAGAPSGTGALGGGGGATSASSASGAGAGSSGGTGGGTGGGPGGAGGGTAQSSAASTTGAGGSAIVIDVSCQGAPCAAGEVCCFAGVGDPSSACGAAGSCGSFAEIACDGPDDCPGAICCATYNQASQTLYGIHCAATCAGVGDEFWMCTGDDTACMPGKSCADDMVLGGGYKFCTQ